MKKDFLSVALLSILLIVGIYFVSKNNWFNKPILADYSDSTAVDKISIEMYGLLVDSFEVIEQKVKPRQNLSSLLSPYGVSSEDIDKIISICDTVFDLRKIRTGNKYVVFCTKDSSKTAEYFVYEHNSIEYILFDLKDTINIFRLEKEVKIETKTVSGSIVSSLWNTMIDNKINPILSIELSEIYAWTIDFFDLQKGDYFKVLYDEQYVDSVSIGISKIHAIYFNHSGHDFYAFPFVQDSIESYFDEKGKSLKKAFLKAPLRFARISSHFSNSRLHPVLKIRRPHHGVDYAAPVGTPVQSIGDGKVILAEHKGGAGKMVKIKHNNTYTTAYLHLSKFGNGIKSGAHVRQGDVIGYVGSTGLSTGPHLDFRVYKNGTPVDPLKMESPPVEPVKKEDMKTYTILADSLVKVLKAVNTN
ncbi:MAG TPA: metalloendopeptidase [Bacteroidales bacterium]|nr:MAG: hypothetical protein A2W98_08610 [Bacteroidetes bacterium GWF2_33_38]OFY74067.1 MAG: hypothetical protein A2265_09475 [Bacteroidetes bacterium RIFOXYA12_FULL_33_9]OFY90273.1 MAG: hypothetical protein A2236_04375 [Bacteroidetes bacterium RIFOXYA2_FULL_33_7]HBF87384.1 metalloendopeptidase [Bacteroidales bacterium]